MLLEVGVLDVLRGALNWPEKKNWKVKFPGGIAQVQRLFVMVSIASIKTSLYIVVLNLNTN